MAKRINKAIELLNEGQPLYSVGAGEVSYEGGLRLAQTWADYINLEMEHEPFDMKGLEAFMLGLVDGSPTASGHRTPAVIMTIPAEGTSEESVRTNAWMIKQVLARGIHGILLCHVETPGAARAFVEAARYPIQDIGVGERLGTGRRGAGGQASAARIWGVTPDEYLRLADPWPLNPDGELLLGVKIENRRALANAEATLAVPGIGFAEWGPGDMGLSFGHIGAHDPPYPADMEEARRTVDEACRRNHVAFLCSWNDPNLAVEQRVHKLLDDQVRVLSGIGEEGARIGRAITGRTMPV
jgi:4-hydroxy-2-oxoheptanedioate aldolase